MAASDVAGDRKAKPHAFLVARTGLIETREGAEGVFVLIGGNARAIVVDGDSDRALFAFDPDENPVAVGGGVVDQIGDAAFEPARTPGRGDVAYGLYFHFGARALGVGDDFLGQRGDIDLRWRFFRLAFREGEIFV